MRSIRVLLATFAGALLIAGVATAQPASDPNAPQPAPGQAPAGEGPSREGPNREGMGRGGMGREGMGRERRDHEREMGEPGHGGWMRHMMEREKAARFDLRRGDTHIVIKCAAGEPMKACMDAAIQLIDRVGAK